MLGQNGELMPDNGHLRTRAGKAHGDEASACIVGGRRLMGDEGAIIQGAAQEGATPSAGQAFSPRLKPKAA
jgi:hypothetical protein